MNEILLAMPYFLLVLVRISSFFIVAPLFSMRGVPAQFKIGLAVFLSMLALSALTISEPLPLDSNYIFMIIKEFAIGISLGFTAALVLYTVQIAGAFIDFQMGFAMASVMDPQTGSQVPIIGHFKYILALLFLLMVDGHHLMLDGIMQSLRMIPVDSLSFDIGFEDLARFISDLFVEMFIVAVQISLPIVGALFLVDVALGILAKTVPQLNIFAVGFPVKILVGFALLMFSMPFFFYLLQVLFEEIMVSMAELARLIGGA
ncbi:flagellar biosynthesis protein FliR [Planococcus glaciei]|uniref:flagellar biosynthetic protein FliR n=1 Tax=Planococcus glaciei TaxID=459472 RepID=UPI00069E96E0|nr:flagellar biosynthetic protein FliR [Planococcus glaciei]KOF09915.1 flagellar biosynthesis protein FliR [Planococcus glaciei]